MLHINLGVIYICIFEKILNASFSYFVDFFYFIYIKTMIIR